MAGNMGKKKSTVEVHLPGLLVLIVNLVAVLVLHTPLHASNTCTTTATKSIDHLYFSGASGSLSITYFPK
jgi:hypothetical protein